MTPAMKRSCPSSTPILKNSSATGIAWPGRPTSLNAPAKPRPCSRPNAKATSHGRRAGKAFPASRRIHDLHRDERDAERDRSLDRRAGDIQKAERRSGQRDAVRDSEGRDSEGDALPAPHKNDERQDEEQMVDAEKNVLDAKPEIGGRHLHRPAGGRDLEGGSAGVRRAVTVSPFSLSIRTRTSVRIVERPSMVMVPSASPAGACTFQRST